MRKSIEAQFKICRNFNCETFFCTTKGTPVRLSNLRKYVWIPTLKKVNIKHRAIKQTRHSLATIALSCGENPLWIAKVMGHSNTEMIIRRYTRYVENITDNVDGMKFNSLYEEPKVD